MIVRFLQAAPCSAYIIGNGKRVWTALLLRTTVKGHFSAFSTSARFNWFSKSTECPFFAKNGAHTQSCSWLDGAKILQSLRQFCCHEGENTHFFVQLGTNQSQACEDEPKPTKVRALSAVCTFGPSQNAATAAKEGGSSQQKRSCSFWHAKMRCQRVVGKQKKWLVSGLALHRLGQESSSLQLIFAFVLNCGT